MSKMDQYPLVFRRLVRRLGNDRYLCLFEPETLKYVCVIFGKSRYIENDEFKTKIALF